MLELYDTILCHVAALMQPGTALTALQQLRDLQVNGLSNETVQQPAGGATHRLDQLGCVAWHGSVDVEGWRHISSLSNLQEFSWQPSIDDVVGVGINNQVKVLLKVMGCDLPACYWLSQHRLCCVLQVLSRRKGHTVAGLLLSWANI